MHRTKIALSASFRDHPEVHAILAQCETIYTTQARHYTSLCETYGADVIRIIPDMHEDIMQVLRKRHEDCEVYHYGHFHALQKAGVLNSEEQGKKSYAR